MIDPTAVPGFLAVTVIAWSAVISGCAVDNRALRSAATGDGAAAGRTGAAGTMTAAVDSGSDGGSGDAATGLAPSCTGCSSFQIGTPTWKPAAAVMVTNPDRTGGIAAGLPAILAPDHVWLPAAGVFGPGQAHGGDYGAEVQNLLVGAHLPPGQTVAAKSLAQTPNILLIVTLVPGPHAPVGRSQDFDDDRIIGDATFPIYASAEILQDRARLNAHQDLSIPSFADLNPFIADGASHVLVVFAQAGALIPGTTNTSNHPQYAWLVIITDSDGMGWELEIPFQIGV